MSKAIEDVIAERKRQINQERFSSKHDDAHTCGEMAQAAACYASAVAAWMEHTDVPDAPKAKYEILQPSFRWPWDRKWWKPKDPRRDLVRAAALIVAEIDRLDRAHAP